MANRHNQLVNDYNKILFFNCPQFHIINGYIIRIPLTLFFSFFWFQNHTFLHSEKISLFPDKMYIKRFLVIFWRHIMRFGLKYLIKVHICILQHQQKMIIICIYVLITYYCNYDSFYKINCRHKMFLMTYLTRYLAA